MPKRKSTKRNLTTEAGATSPALVERAFAPPDMEAFNITILGRFNRYIVEPGWVMKHNVIAPGDFEMLMLVGGSPPLYRGQDDLCWTVHADRLVVFGNREKAPLFLEKLLETLPHTPVTAVGVNFRTSIKCTSNPAEHGLSLKNCRTEAPAESSESRVYPLARGVKLTVRVTWGDEDKSVLTNFHTDATDGRVLSAHAGRVKEFERQTMELLKKL